ncbi:hypothetical protein D3C78_1674780 [compost metagenome]
MRKEINLFSVLIATFPGVGIDKAESLGIVEPFHLADSHAQIPLQQTPSLEYHPIHPQSNPLKGLTPRIFFTHCGLYWL